MIITLPEIYIKIFAYIGVISTLVMVSIFLWVIYSIWRWK